MIEKIFKTPRMAAMLSIMSNTILVVSKISIGIFGGSVSILSEGIHSSLDLIAAIIAFFSVSLSAQPVDEKHPYGHGKIENVSGTIEAFLIIVAGGLIIKEAVHKLHAGGKIEHIEIGIAVMLVSVVMNIFVSRVLFIVAKKSESQALEADAHHLSTDVMTSAGVFGGLILVRLTGLVWLDAVVAFGVAALIIWIGVKVLFNSFVDLIDQKLPEEEEKKIRAIIEEHSDMFVEYHQMRTRKSGAMRYIDLHLVVAKNQNLEEAHDLCDHLEDDISRLFKSANITIHVEPAKSLPSEPA
jgi:cation diffusion facilitator family transporter